MEDRELLLEYVSKRTESAFAELVQRHISLVYSTAMRLLGDAQSAQDVCQAVFIRLARKADSIREGNALPGWLYRATYNEALTMLRNEKRRRLREVEAMKVAENQNDTSSVWEAVGPLLDEGMSKLGRLEQDAVVLRFFQNKPLTEIGQALGVSEDAARKRISRALEKLRAHFARRGLQVSSAVLVSAIAAHAVQATPATLVSGLAATCITGSTSLGAASLISKLIQTVTMSKLKYTAVTALVLAAACIPIAMQDSNHKLKTENAKLLDYVGQKNSELAEMQASLGGEIEELQNRLQKNDAENIRLRQQVTALERSATGTARPGNAARATNPSVSPDQDVVRVKRSNISSLQFDVLTSELQLADAAIDLLELTPSEITQVKNFVAQFKNKVQSHDLANVRQVSPSEVSKDGISVFFAGKEGQFSAYRIAPYDQQEQQAIRDWADKTLREIIGPDRAGRFLKDGQTLDYWIGGTEDKILALIDRFNAQGQPIEREWMISYKTPFSSGSYSGRGAATVPPQLRYLYEAADAKATE